MNKKKRNKKKYSLVITLIISILIIIIVIYTKTIPIYNVSDRTQILVKKQNEDDTVFAWLKVQGTNIDYPIVYSDTEKFEQGEYDYDYLWTNSYSTKLNSRVIVWGHNIRNVSSKPLINQKDFNYFENLPSFLYYDFVKDNKYIQYTINGKNYLYKIYAVSMIDKSKFNHNEYMVEKEKKEYINQTIKESYFKFDVDIGKNPNLITLATCTRFFGNDVLVIKIDGVKVEDNEKIRNYKVTKNNKNYNKIEKIMKGDDKNE